MVEPGKGRDKGASDEVHDNGGADDTVELSLNNPDERLPWLESAEDDFDDGVDSGRIVAFALVGLMAVVALVGALWWFTRDRPDPEMIADGSTIEAPDVAYKFKPSDKGGEKVAGTGDRSFAVAEGNSVEGRIGNGGPAQAPAAVAAASPSVDRGTGPAAAPAAAAAATGAIGVQVGAFSSREKAEAAWSQLQGRLAPLQGRSHRVIQGTADSGAIFRLQAVSGTLAEAETLCHALRAAGGDCQVKR